MYLILFLKIFCFILACGTVGISTVAYFTMAISFWVPDTIAPWIEDKIYYTTKNYDFAKLAGKIMAAFIFVVIPAAAVISAISTFAYTLK